ncbi:hypothetical protein AVEN_260575-1 [Araneus ventricosus]|uniref:Uncharacterized protein n=1 Tax=Araneus ventricosus TaxID=182803 RepID=A0A4Y2M1K2_ARAVE|nr:hypothetical protein AVEN_260575-1 [Araneus ventricosus]
MPRPVGETIKGTSSESQRIVSVLIDFELVGRLGPPLECERLLNLSLEFYPLCELVVSFKIGSIFVKPAFTNPIPFFKGFRTDDAVSLFVVFSLFFSGF